MKIRLAKAAGFCFGVRRAIQTALRTAVSGKKVYMLGDIVHNEAVVRRIQAAGIKKIRRLGDGKNKVLLMRAHGAPPAVFAKALRRGYAIADATCPMVKEIHRIARQWEKKGREVIVVGDRKHEEVRGIVGQLKKRAFVIDDIGRIPAASLKKIRKACVVVQSTQNLEKVALIVAALRKLVADLEFFNTICQPTRLRQEETKKMSLENDVMIVIGSKKSANTKRLYEIAKSLNKRSYWVTSRKDICKEWFAGARTVGVTAGASTPDATTRQIIRFISRTP